MKVEKIYQLYEVLGKIDREIEWKDVIQFSEDEQDMLIKALNEENPNTYLLYQFYHLVHDEDDRFSEEDFEHLEIDDIKGVIAQEILNAETPQMAENIYLHFNSCPDAFYTEEEFLIYLRSMSRTICLGESYPKEISYLLSHYEEYRNELILEFSKYYDTVSNPKSFSINCPEVFEISSCNMRKFLELMSLDYDCKITSRLMLKLEEQQRKYLFAEQMFSNVTNCLTNKDFHCTALAKIFLYDSFEYYPEVIDMIYYLIDHRAFDILCDYAEVKLYKDNERAVLREGIYDVVSGEDQELMHAFDILLGNGYLERFLNRELPLEEKQKTINLIIRKLNHSESSKMLAELLLKMPLDAWRPIPKDTEQEILDLIYSNLWLYIDREIFDQDKKSTYNVFANLSNLTLETNQKFVELLSFPSFLNDPKKDEILSILLSKENEPNFDYIFNQYRQEEMLRQKRRAELEKQQLVTDEQPFQVQLATVVELLDSGYRVDSILDGFEPDEDITPKTLVRSMKYKESHES